MPRLVDIDDHTNNTMDNNNWTVSCEAFTYPLAAQAPTRTDQGDASLSGCYLNAHKFPLSRTPSARKTVTHGKEIQTSFGLLPQGVNT
jgi:hypothetical protein